MIKRHPIVTFIICFILLIGIILGVATAKAPDIGESKMYFCDVKVFTLRTNITVTQNDEPIANIRGSVLRFFTDPLSMYDSEGNKIAYGADEYHFINQDSHAIFVNNALTIEMVGKFSIFGDKYDIYDRDGQLIAKANFNALNSYGTIIGTDGTLWADYYSFFYRLDYKVRITEACKIDDTSVLMMMASFYSDRSADAGSHAGSHSS